MVTLNIRKVMNDVLEELGVEAPEKKKLTADEIVEKTREIFQQGEIPLEVDDMALASAICLILSNGLIKGTIQGSDRNIVALGKAIATATLVWKENNT